MVKRKKPWLSYRTTLVPAPRTTACAKTRHSWGRRRPRVGPSAREFRIFFDSAAASFSLRGRRSPQVLAAATWDWLGLAWLVGKSPSQERHPPPSVWLPDLSLCSYCHKGRSCVLAQSGGMIGFLVLSPSHNDEDDPESRISHNPKRITHRHISWIAADSLPSCSLSTRLMLCKLVVVVSFLEGKERKGKGRFK